MRKTTTSCNALFGILKHWNLYYLLGVFSMFVEICNAQNFYAKWLQHIVIEASTVCSMDTLFSGAHMVTNDPKSVEISFSAIKIEIFLYFVRCNATLCIEFVAHTNTHTHTLYQWYHWYSSMLDPQDPFPIQCND